MTDVNNTTFDSMDGWGNMSHLSEPLHGEVEAPPRNPLADDLVYTKLKGNKFFEVQPSIVHFSGFSLEHVHQQVVRIVNISHLTKRLHILQCQSPNFSIHYQKRGKIAPGMSEEVIIQFTPNEWRYYYDCIRIHSEDENLLVPVHAYPTVAPLDGGTSLSKSRKSLRSTAMSLGGAPESSEYFPKRIDFGWCQLCQRVVKHVPITCSIPVEFEFRVTLVQPHADMEITPLHGKVPANGQAYIQIAYTPSRMATAEMTIEVNISQFGFKPQKCLVVGSTTAGTVRQATIQNVTKKLMDTGQVSQGFVLEQDGGAMEAGEGRADLTMVHDEAKGFQDKVTRMREERVPGSPIQIRRAEPPPKDPETEYKSLRFPADLRPRAATQYVLNQVQGKLSYKELKKRMQESGEMPMDEQALDPKAKAIRSIQWYETTRMQPGGFLDVEEEYGAGQTTQALEFKYDYELRMREEYDRAKEVKWFPAVGDDPPDAEELEAVAERRRQREEGLAARERERLRGIATTIADGSARVVHKAGPPLAFTPTFDPYLNDAWTVRKEVTERFRAEMRALMVRNRVARRIAAINGKLDLVGSGARGQLVDSILAADSAPNSSQGQREDGRVSNIRLDRFITNTFPVYREGNFRDRERVAVSEISEFEELGFIDLKVPKTFKLMGYHSETLPPVPSYVALQADRQLRTGAQGEEGLRGARGRAEELPASELLPMPMLCCNPPPIYPTICRALDARNRPAEGQALCMINDPVLPCQETDATFALRTRQLVIGDPELKQNPCIPDTKRGLRLEEGLFGVVIEGQVVGEPEAPGFNAVRALQPSVAPLMSSKWLPRRELSSLLSAPLPTMMIGPDAEDAQSDEEQDEEGGEEKDAPVVIAPPTPEFVKENFKIPKLKVTDRKSVV